MQIDNLQTTAQVAKSLGVNKSSVSRRAIACNLGRMVGLQRMFTKSEAKKIGKLLGKPESRPGPRPTQCAEPR